MARANRYYIPGTTWHISHRCHKKEFLLKFAKDRQRWVYWLFEARKRYGLRILNYIVTSNHIHLLVVDTGKDVIPRSLQLVAGRTAQEFNQRKKRKGAFWEDRYHAVAVESDEHLTKCLVYMDLNMVRAGVVKHPSHWDCSGHNEIMQPRKRYRLIDYETLLGYCGTRGYTEFCRDYIGWIDEALQNSAAAKESLWTESIAVGSKEFIEDIKTKMGSKAKGRQVRETDDKWGLCESEGAYNTNFTLKKYPLRPENALLWNICHDESAG